MYRYLAIGCAILSLTACCDCATNIDADQLQQLTVGQTTSDDVKAKFGTPNETSSKDGETIWTYDFRYEDIKWTTYIPVLGGFVDSADKKTQKDRFVFDSEGKLKSYTRYDAINLPGG